MESEVIKIKTTLRKHLKNRELNLHKEIHELQRKLLSENFTESDTIKLSILEAQLNEICNIIDICEERNKW